MIDGRWSVSKTHENYRYFYTRDIRGVKNRTGSGGIANDEVIGIK